MFKTPINPNVTHSKEPIICDYLAFTVPLSHFELLDKAGVEYRKYWQKMPTGSLDNVTNPDDRYKLIQSYHRDVKEILFKRMTQFLSNIMGLQVVPVSLDKGFYGYKDSHNILDMTGKVHLGFVGIGGNNNTLYIQISGEGCKHVFANVSPTRLHFWLSDVLLIDTLRRIDLAYDCFDGYFSCDYAALCYADGMFQNPRGGPEPEWEPRPSYRGKLLLGEIHTFGSRKSNTFWRVYDKGREQGVEQSWYRSEVELKRKHVDVLLDFKGVFSGLNAFSSSFDLGEGKAIRSSKKRTVLDLAGKIRWAKRQCGRTLSDLLELFGGDLHLAFGALCDERGGKFSLPDTQSILINNHVHTHMNVLNHSKLALGVDLAIRNKEPLVIVRKPKLHDEELDCPFTDFVAPILDTPEDILIIKSVSSGRVDLYNHGLFLESASLLAIHKRNKNIAFHDSKFEKLAANRKKETDSLRYRIVNNAKINSLIKAKRSALVLEQATHTDKARRDYKYKRDADLVNDWLERKCDSECIELSKQLIS